MSSSGQMINLNKLVYGNGKNYLLVSATAINDNGQIVASAYGIYDGDVHAVLLTPTGAYPGEVITMTKSCRHQYETVNSVSRSSANSRETLRRGPERASTRQTP